MYEYLPYITKVTQSADEYGEDREDKRFTVYEHVSFIHPTTLTTPITSQGRTL